MAEIIIAHCGRICSECPAYKATQADDPEMLELTAKRWSPPWHRLTQDDVRCDGCTLTGKHKSVLCRECRVRECGFGSDIGSCTSCEDHPCCLIESLEHVQDGDGAETTETRPDLEVVPVPARLS